MRPRPLVLVVLALLASFVLSVDPIRAQKKVFATFEAKFGDLTDWDQAGPGTSGVDAANSICQKLAEDATLDNPGDYRAWLSDSTTDAYCNVAGFSGKKVDNCGQPALPDGGPWVLTNGRPFARSLSELTASDAVLWAPRVDQSGATLFGTTSNVLTGTQADGTRASYDCNGWIDSSSGQSAGSGALDAGAVGWTAWTNAACDSLSRLYCFESGSGAPLGRFAEPGAYAFVTSATGTGILGGWDDAAGESGIAAGDAICRQAASDGRLPAPDSFIAWLSDDSTDVKDRLVVEGPFRRPDGVQIADSRIQFLTSLHEAAIETDEHGDHLSVYTLTGSFTNGSATDDNCSNWLSEEGIFGAGLSSAAGSFWSSGLAGDCDVPDHYHLFCVSNLVTLFADSFEDGLPAWSFAQE